MGVHEGLEDAIRQGAGAQVGQEISELGHQADRSPDAGLVILVDAQAHQGLGPGVAQGQAGEDGEPGESRPPGPGAQGQQHHGDARARRPQAQQCGGAQARQGGDQTRTGEDPGGRRGLHLSHGGRAHVGEQDGLEQYLHDADGQSHEGHDGHEGAHARPCRHGAPTAQKVVCCGGVVVGGAATSHGSHDGDRAGHGDQAGGGVQGQQPPQSHQGQEEAGQQRGQEVPGGGGRLQQPRAADVVVLVDQVGHGGAQCGLSQRRQAGGGRHTRQDVGEPGLGDAQSGHDDAQSEH